MIIPQPAAAFLKSLKLLIKCIKKTVFLPHRKHHLLYPYSVIKITNPYVRIQK
jgi:hypothetical protein